MKNVTPVILGMLMLTSFLAGVSFTEFEEPTVIDNAAGRSGADPSVLAITNPKETTCDDINGCRNTLYVGDATTFQAYIQNSGDADVTELGYTVTVYLTDADGNVGNVAKDANGQDLRWENPNVMCDDITICNFDSSADPLLPSSYLEGGKHTLQLDGGAGDVVWTPSAGQYIVEIAVNSPDDADGANNAELVFVIVEDWYDIVVDLTWQTGDNADVLDASSLGGDAEFQLSVLANGSETFNPREVTIELRVAGDVGTATNADGTIDFAAGDAGTPGVTLITVGTPQTVTTFQNESNVNDTTSDSRHILEYQNAWTMTGFFSPNADSEARFEISAELVKYTMYDQHQSCEVIDDTDPENVTTYRHFCEEEINNDDRANNDFDEIVGSKITYDDIRISRMGVYQGYSSDGSGNPSTFTRDTENADLNVGFSRVFADIEHRGSDSTKAYGWNVSYTISLDGNTVLTGVVDECAAGTDVPYTHAPLGGMGNNLFGSVCVEVSLEPGEYTFEFDLVMNNKNGMTLGGMQYSGATDARPSNNDRSMTSTVVNNLPVITSFELVTEGDLVVGQQSPLVFSVAAFDVDDPSGAGLKYAYNTQNGGIIECPERLSLDGGTLCSTPVTADYIGNLIVTVIVTDQHGGTTSMEMDLAIWNDAVGTATSDAGITLEYALTYFGTSDFTIDTFADMDASVYDAVQLEGFSGTYSAVAVIDYAPSATRTANEILDQELRVIVGKDLDATSLWYIDSNNRWIMLSDAAVDVDATTEVFVYDIPDNSPVVPSGTMVLMGGELAQATVPDASVSGFNAEALPKGAIGLTWDITGTLLSSDNIRISICPGEAVSEACADLFTQNVPDEDRSFTYSGASTTHGVEYHVEVAVCNEQGCSTPAGVGSVTADKRVDGDVMATDLTVTEDGENWIVRWGISGDTADVAMWHVCYQRGSDFEVGEMPTDCPDGAEGADVKELTIAKPTTAGTYEYYFTAVPMDALGNMNAAASMNSINYFRESDTSNANDGNGTITDGGDGADAGVPMWTWGVIGGVVIVAFVVGAFILSRGDGEGGEGKDWDY
jgi:hypothetical protein